LRRNRQGNSIWPTYSDSSVGRIPGGHMEERWKVESSPVHRAIWKHGEAEAFDSEAPEVAPSVRAAMDRSLAVVRRHKQSRSLYGTDGIIDLNVIAELAAAGYWGLRADAAYGGAGANFQALARFITDMAVVDPWVGG
jgi:alkylation response protein AidB-like acyl-CoA dehydrogenase